ncbi:hypothetical protein [Streptomyces scabiei]|nr:hypothetical protein [Streptomyces scabiei]MDX3517684.1 hypothetical protein [Streptomyces scabiei]
MPSRPRNGPQGCLAHGTETILYVGPVLKHRVGNRDGLLRRML